MAQVVSNLKAIAARQIGIEEYLVWSTILSILMFFHLKGTFQAGYVVVILNSLILLAANHFAIHRTHMAAILALAAFSIIGARSAGTPFTAVASQILGISVLSIYFLNAVTSFEVSATRWMELYMRAAFYLAVFSLVTWPAVVVISGDPRLRGLYSEPSYYVYVTLPAVSYCINRYVKDRRYGTETLVFLLSYAFADSALGFLGLFLSGALAYAPRFKGLQLLAGGLAMCVLAGGVYLASANVRVRLNETVTAVTTQDLSGTGPSTFAFLANVYVASQSFLEHPLTGIGIGGYANAYDKYVGDVSGAEDLLNSDRTFVTSMQLNRDDAASMFLRVAAELGLPGLAILAGFLLVCARVRGEPYVIIRNAILPYLIVRMMRMGHYFTVELYFFAGIYLINFLSYRSSRRQLHPREN